MHSAAIIEADLVDAPRVVAERLVVGALEPDLSGAFEDLFRLG